MATVVGMFEHMHEANHTVDDLTSAGFTKSQIGVVARKEVLKKGGLDVATGAEVGAISGATTGGIAGLLVGLGAITIPALAIPVAGEVVAAGSFLIALGALVIGLVGGGIAGGLVGALAGFGISEARAQQFAEGVAKGHILVTVQAEPDRAQTAADIMRTNNALEVDVSGMEVPGLPPEIVPQQQQPT
ncbi:MAG TPA: general stress protein [Ktedonobacterales bacterium]|nr:general stress protein [Ktedonobacterales bacterium]